jgi:hypothetical protein
MPSVHEVMIATNGEVALRFLDGDALSWEMPRIQDSEDVEYWRLFQPGLLTAHFVVSSSGNQWHGG